MVENQDLSQTKLLSIFYSLLKGEAANLFRQKWQKYASIWVDGNMEMVFLIMGKHFGDGTAQVPWTQFHNLSQEDNEEVEDWAAQVLILTHRAFPSLSQADMRKRALSKFWDGLADSKMATFVGQCQPHNLEGAVDCCIRFSTYNSSSSPTTEREAQVEQVQFAKATPLGSSSKDDPKGNGSMWTAHH